MNTMTIGMLWFDNNHNKSFEDKLQQAAAYYKDKYGIEPTLCFVSFQDYSKPPEYEGMVISCSDEICTNHMWLGVRDSECEDGLYTSTEGGRNAPQFRPS